MNIEDPKQPQRTVADMAEKMAELLERLSKSPAIPYAYRIEAEKLVKEWRK